MLNKIKTSLFSAGEISVYVEQWKDIDQEESSETVVNQIKTDKWWKEVKAWNTSHKIFKNGKNKGIFNLWKSLLRDLDEVKGTHLK